MINKNTIITIFNEMILFGKFFVFFCPNSDVRYNVVQSEVNDCVIKNVVQKKSKP